MRVFPERDMQALMLDEELPPVSSDLTPHEIAVLAAQFVEAHARYLEERAQLFVLFRDDRVPLETFVQKVMHITEQQRKLKQMRQQIQQLSNELTEHIGFQARLAL